MSKETSEQYLGDFVFEKRCFDDLEAVFSYFKSESFTSLTPYRQKEQIHLKLYDLIKSHEKRQFLFLEVLDYIYKIRENHLIDKYNLLDFELWLNQFSGISEEENYYIRGLIAGKYIPRDEYQAVFPIGMGKTYDGTHVVTAHSSPDLDTIVASFWGWMDAFSAKVSRGLHIWNVPGGAPASHVEVELLFLSIFGEDIFSCLSKSRSQLSLTSFDLMTQEGFVIRKQHELSLSSSAERSQAGVIIVDEEGCYLGDWRSFDVESIRQVIMTLNSCLRWLESELQLKLITLFSKPELSKQDIEAFKEKSYQIILKQCDPFQEFTHKQAKLLDAYLKKVLKVEKGVEASFLEFSLAVQKVAVADFSFFQKTIDALLRSEMLFNQMGLLIDNRPLLFFHLEKIIHELNDAFRSFRLYVDTLDIAYKVKTEVFGFAPQYLSYRTDVEEIFTKMSSYNYLTVNVPGPENKQIPVGIVTAAALQKKILGTVTLRDFCNRDETKVPPYFEVISVIDHHKSVISTTTAPTAILTDAQSANSVVAQQAFQMQDKYSLSCMDNKEIDEQIKQMQKEAKTSSDFRVLRNLYLKKEALLDKKFFVSPQRQWLEYSQYIFAILDDTDLLTKVSYRDVLSVKDLLNRLKSIFLKKEVEIVHFDDIDKDEHFVERAAKKLLQNKDLYSLYSRVYFKKEQVVEDNLKRCAKGETSNIFVDTKIQNGCARVGQTKIFAKNYPFFDQRKINVRNLWFEQSTKIFGDNSDIDLHIHMISTIASAEELFKGEKDVYLHKDQMWIWIPETELAVEHLKYFLSVFKNSPKIVSNDIELEFYGPRSKELALIFQESFLNCEQKFSEEQLDASYAVIYYDAGSINSRKAAVSPFLPKVGVS